MITCRDETMKFDEVNEPSSSEPIIRYRSNPLRLRSLPRPKSSLVHWSTPDLFRTRQAITTVSPTTAVWSSGSRSKRWAMLQDTRWHTANTSNNLQARFGLKFFFFFLFFFLEKFPITFQYIDWYIGIIISSGFPHCCICNAVEKKLSSNSSWLSKLIIY